MEYNKEKYKAQLQKRKTVLLSVVLGCSSIITLKIADSILGFFNVNEKTADFLIGMVIGLATTFMVFAGFCIGNIQRTLHDEEKMKAMWIKENDERLKAIEQKSLSIGFRITAIILGFGSMIGALFSLEIFIGIFVALSVMLFVKIITRAYYNKKM